jgi:charged multivesicular body protein 7
VKVKSPGDTSSALSTQDRTIGSLKSLIADLSGQVALLSAKILELSETAQTAVRNKNKVSALAALRSKKLNETVLAQRTETLFQLEEVYSKIEQAADQVAMVRVMEASAGVLRSLHAEVGGVEKVDDVMEGLGYEMSKVEEVGSAIEARAHEQNVVDEDAVDEELESLERQARSEQEEKEARETQEKLDIIGEMGELKDREVSRQDAIPTNGTSPLQAPRGAPETPIEAGINALNRLSLDEERSSVANVSEAPEKPAERILNAASET